MPRILKLKTYKSDDGAVVLSVEDSGPGIPVELHDKIFDSFFTTKKGKGTGLGLSVIRTVMGRLGGTIKLEPSQEGAKFILTFPKCTIANTNIL